MKHRQRLIGKRKRKPKKIIYKMTRETRQNIISLYQDMNPKEIVEELGLDEQLVFDVIADYELGKLEVGEVIV